MSMNISSNYGSYPPIINSSQLSDMKTALQVQEKIAETEKNTQLQTAIAASGAKGQIVDISIQSFCKNYRYPPKINRRVFLYPTVCPLPFFSLSHSLNYTAAFPLPFSSTLSSHLIIPPAIFLLLFSASLLIFFLLFHPFVPHPHHSPEISPHSPLIFDHSLSSLSFHSHLTISHFYPSPLPILSHLSPFFSQFPVFSPL